MNISRSRNTKGTKYKAKHNKFNIAMTLLSTDQWQRMTIEINFWYVSNFLSTSAGKTRTTLCMNVNNDFVFLRKCKSTLITKLCIFLVQTRNMAICGARLRHSFGYQYTSIYHLVLICFRGSALKINLKQLFIYFWSVFLFLEWNFSRLIIVRCTHLTY